MSEIYSDDEVTQDVRDRAYEGTERILEVRVNPETHQLIFIGTGALVGAMAFIDVERYLAEKLSQMRGRFASEIEALQKEGDNK